MSGWVFEISIDSFGSFFKSYNSNFSLFILCATSLILLSIKAPLSSRRNGILFSLFLILELKTGTILTPSKGLSISDSGNPTISAIVGKISIVEAG